jgi:hypothetical protein
MMWYETLNFLPIYLVVVSIFIVGLSMTGGK